MIFPILSNSHLSAYYYDFEGFLEASRGFEAWYLAIFPIKTDRLRLTIEPEHPIQGVNFVFTRLLGSLRVPVYIYIYHILYNVIYIFVTCVCIFIYVYISYISEDQFLRLAVAVVFLSIIYGCSTTHQFQGPRRCPHDFNVQKNRVSNKAMM